MPARQKPKTAISSQSRRDAPPHLRPPQQREDHRGEQRAQQHRAAGPHLVEQRLGHRAADLHRRHRRDDERDGRHSVSHSAVKLPAMDHATLERIFEGHDAPFALVDLDAMWSNAEEMLARSAGKPIRVASKSVRSRAVIERILARDERFRGLMTFTLDETLWLHGHGFRDLLLAYPTADRAALAELGRLEGEGRPIVMVDSAAQLDLIASAAGVARRADPALHRVRHRLPHGARAGEDRPEALAHPHARAGRGAGHRDHRARRARAGRADGLRGPHRRGGRPAAGQAAPGPRDPADAALVGGRDRRAPGGDRGGGPGGGARSSW